MNMQNRRTAWLQFSMALLLCVALMTAALGTTYARYKMDSSRAFKMTYEAKTDQVYIRAVENIDTVDAEDVDTENVSAENGDAENASTEATKENFEMEFVLSNGTARDSYCTYDQTATLSMFATLGLEEPENYTITLTDGWTVYEAECRKVAEGTVWYSLYGPGWIYSFYNEAGEEISWHLSGTRFIEKKMVITIEGESELPAALSLIASAKPEEI